MESNTALSSSDSDEVVIKCNRNHSAPFSLKASLLSLAFYVLGKGLGGNIEIGSKMLPYFWGREGKRRECKHPKIGLYI